MESSPFPRFKRSPSAVPIHLTTRDNEIIRLVYRYRFLRSHKIMALLGTNSRHILRRLQLLYHHGYLERPRAQIDYFHQGGSHHMVYGIGNKGATLLKQAGDIFFRKISWGEKNRSIGRIFLQHALLVSDIMSTIELACRTSAGIRLINDMELLGKESQSIKWNVSIKGRKLGIIPDHVFALERINQSGHSIRVIFFLEADRGTMPIVRSNLSQTSFYRKLLAYEATWAQSIHQTRFGFNRFRVLTVTTSATRVKSLVDTCSHLKRGRGLFLFADRSVLDNPDVILSFKWQTGSYGDIASLIE